MIATDKKKYNQSFILTFILLGHFSSAQELSYRSSQHVFGRKQRTDEQRKTVLGKQQQWIPYIFFNPTVCTSLLQTWNIWVDSDPGAREDRDKTTPNNVPD